MKNLKFFLFPVICLLAGLFVTNVAQANTGDDSLLLDAFKFKAEVTFGAPPKCEGWGVCKLILECCSGRLQPGVGVGELAADKGHLAIGYLKNSMTPETIQKQFGNGTFIVSAPYTLTDDVTEALGLKSGYTIQPGKYKVVDGGETLNVVY